MSIFNQMLEELKVYPVSNVTIEIVEVTFTGAAINTNEKGSFRVKVTNNGPLHLTGVTLRVSGHNGVTVANNSVVAPFVSDFITQELPTINAHGGSQLTVGSPLRFSAPAGAQASKPLIKATLEGWDASLDHMLIAHSDPLRDEPKGVYAAAVVIQ